MQTRAISDGNDVVVLASVIDAESVPVTVTRRRECV